jgi:dTDP-4-dehydrorhamnose 3,5-epimerase-like enzyme
MKVIIKKFKKYSDHTGSLVPFYKKKSFNNFQIIRFFFIYGKKNKQRADHAHKKCNQIYIPIAGDAHIEITNTKNKIKKVLLSEKNKKFLIIPKMNWIKIKFKKNSSLLVLCDYKYDKKEYIQDFKEFLNYEM